MSQEKVNALLARKGDCPHIEFVERPLFPKFENTCACGKLLCVSKKRLSEKVLAYRFSYKPDLTTPDGVFWMLKRLPEWDRYIEFCEWWSREEQPFLNEEHYGVDCMVVFDILTWLATDAENGKAPALYKAICGFMGWEVEGA